MRGGPQPKARLQNADAARRQPWACGGREGRAEPGRPGELPPCEQFGITLSGSRAPAAPCKAGLPSSRSPQRRRPARSDDCHQSRLGPVSSSTTPVRCPVAPGRAPLPSTHFPASSRGCSPSWAHRMISRGPSTSAILRNLRHLSGQNRARSHRVEKQDRIRAAPSDDPKQRQSDLSHAKSVLGCCSPQRGLKDGLGETIGTS